MKIIFTKKTHKKQAIISVFVTLIFFSAFFSSQFFVSEAVFNKQINYQGKLTLASGVAVANGNYNIEVKLYTVSTGGTAIWTETRTLTNRVTVTNGLFSVMLGDVTALTSVDFNQTLYLGVNIGGIPDTPSWDGEMSPRKKLGTVPSAVEAENAATAVKSTNLVGGNSTTLLGSIPYQSNTDTTTLLAPNTTTTKKFLNMTGDGTNGAIPAWDTLADADIPSALTGKTYNGLTITNNGTNTLNIAAGQTLTVTTGGTLGSAAYTDSTAYEVPLTFSSGLTRSVNTITNNLITGLAGGQTIIGGTGVGDGLIYKSTTGAGITTGIAHQFVGGTDGGTVIATMLNDGKVGIGIVNPETALDVNGSGLIRQALTVADNTVTKPYSSFGSNSTSHELSNPADVLFSGKVEIDGVLYLDGSIINSGTLTVSDDFQVDGVIKLSDGSAANPSYTFTNDLDTGIYRAGTNALGLTTGGTSRLYINETGNIGIGLTSPTAVLHLKAGTTAAGTAPLKLTSGNLNTTAEAGAIEFLTDAYYGTITTDAVRKQFAFTSDLTTALGAYVPYTGATTNVNLGAYTLTTPSIIGGADVGSNIIYKSTTGAGTAAGIAHQFVGGTDGGTVIQTMLNNGNVGIGTTAPGTLLSVQMPTSTGITRNMFLVNPDQTAGTWAGESLHFGYLSSNENASSRIVGFQNPNTSPYFGSRLQIQTHSTTSTVWNTGLFMNESGNLGIGTTSPTANLQVAQGTAGVGTISNSASGTTVTGVGTQFLNTFKVGDTITANGETHTIATITSNTSLTTDAWTGANSGVAYTLVGGTRFSVLGSGNVGIGTTAPTAKLDVSDGAIVLSGNPGSPGASLRYIGTAGSAGNFWFNVPTSYYFRFAVNDVEKAQISTAGTLQLDGNINVDGTGDNYFAGNVGMGISTPLEKIHIVKSSNFSLLLQDTTTNNDESTYANINFFGSNATYNSAMPTSQIKFVRTSAGADGGITFGTRNEGGTAFGERMRINEDGKVGIGTTAPTAVLHLKAGTTAAGTAPLKLTSGNLMTTAEAGAIEFLTDAYYATITTGAARKQFAFTSDLTTGYVPYTGATTNVNLGAYTLTTPSIIGGSAAGSNIIYKSTTGTGTAAGIAHQFVGGTDGGTVIQTMLNNGNVGIGTTSPETKLEVSGQSRFNSGASFSAIDTGWASSHGYLTGNWGVRLGATGGAGVIQAAQSATIYPLSLQPYGGNVGIGTTGAPTSLFQVTQPTTSVGTVATTGTTTLTGTGTKFLDTFKPYDTVTVSGETVRTVATVTSDTVLTVSVAFANTASGLTYTLGGGDRFIVRGNGNVKIGTNVTTNERLSIGMAGAENNLVFATATNAYYYMGLTRSGYQPYLGFTVKSDPAVNNSFIKSTVDVTNMALFQIANATGDFNVALKPAYAGGLGDAFDPVTESRFIIKLNQNAGIGTATPVSALDVAQRTEGPGTVATTGTTTLTGTGTQFTNTFKVGDTLTVSGETVRTIATITSDTVLTVSVAFANTASGLTYTLTGGTRFSVKGNGNVGIGTTAPDGNLHVMKVTAGTVTANTDADEFTIETNVDGGMSILTPNNRAASIFFGDPNDNRVGRIQYWHTDNSLRLYTNSTEQFRINTSGSVGIGTTSPTAVLHLKAGTTAAETAPLKFTSGNLNTTAEAGAIEFLTDDYFATITTGAARKKISLLPTDASFALTAAKTFTVQNTLTLAGTDGSTLNIGTGGTLGTGAYATIANYLPLAGGTMTGNLLFTDNTLDIGASGATRPRTLYTGTSIVSPAILASANDSGAIGASGTAFSDLFLASGGVINWLAGASTLTHSTNTLTIGGSGATTLALGTNSLTMTGSIGATGARVTKLWTTDLEMTNLPSVNGTALTTTVARLNYLTNAAGSTGTNTTNIVFSTSPALTTPTVVTSIVGDATFAAFNTTTTALTFGGAATTMTIGGTPTTAITHNYSTNATANATIKTVNLGTGGVAGSTSNINIGSASGGTLTINSPTTAHGTGSITMTGSLGATGARVLKGWFTDIESTNMPTVGGTSLSATFAGIAQTMYIGTTGVAINRASAPLTLAGITLTTPEIGVATGTSLDLGTTTLYASRAITVDTGGVFNIDIGSASGDDFTVDTNKLVVEGDTGNVGIGITNPHSKLTINGSLSLVEATNAPDATAGYGKLYTREITTADTDIYTVILLHADGINGSQIFTDEVGRTIVVHGDTEISTTQAKFGQSGYFDGTGDALSVSTGGAGGDFDIGYDDGTIDFWMYPTALTGYLFRFGNGYKIEMDVANICFWSDSGIGLCENIGEITINTWQHIAVTQKDGVSTLYINGIARANNGGEIDNWNAPDETSYIGAYDSNTANFTGYIDEFRISKGIARWTTSFTPPLTAYGESKIVLAYKNSLGEENILSGTLWDGTTNNNIWSLNTGNVGIGTTTPGAKLTVVGTTAEVASFEGFEDAVPPTTLDWSTGGDYTWTQVGSNYYSGIASATNYIIADNESTWLDVNYTFSAAGNIIFYWAVSSEANYDYLLFCVDNDSCTRTDDYNTRISGEVNWTRVTVPVSAGAHSFRWLYAKDGGEFSGSDHGWVDAVTFEVGGFLIDAKNGTTSKFYVTNSGNGYFAGDVGIGMTDASVALDVTGDIEYTGTLTDVSDERLKENILPITGALDMVLGIQGKYFNMINTPNRLETGFIAQNVQLYVPSSVSMVDPLNGYLGVNYLSLIPIAFEAIKELDLKIKDMSSLDTTSVTSLGSLIKNFLGNIMNGIENLYASVIYSSLIYSDRIETQMLCIGSICITEDQLMEIVNKNVSTQLPPNNSEPEPELTPELEPEIEPTLETPNCTEPQILIDNVCTDPSPEPEVVVEPEPIPEEPTPEPEVVVEPEPEVVVEPKPTPEIPPTPEPKPTPEIPPTPEPKPTP